MPLVCPACEGRRAERGPPCPACGGAGEFELTTCPMEYVTPDVWAILRECEFLDMGIPPVGGGLHDQTQLFADVYRFVKSEEAVAERAKLDQLRRQAAAGNQ